jgi:predicted MFS family arabinose efflux permease
LFVQNGLGFSPFDAALTVLPLAFAFVIGSRLAAGRLQQRGVVALVEGCVVQAAGVAGTALLICMVAHPTIAMLMLPLVLFGYGQGMVLAPLFSAVLTNVRHEHAGSGSGILTTTQQVANGAGVVLAGAVYFAVQATQGDRLAFLATLMALAFTIAATIGFLVRMRPSAVGVTVPSA